QGGDGAALIGQLATPQITDGNRYPVCQHDPAHGVNGKARNLLQHGRQEGEGNERAAVAHRCHCVHQQQSRLGEDADLLTQRGRFAVYYVLGHKEQATQEGDHTQGRDSQEGGAPAELLADKGAQRYARHQGNGQAGEHDGNGAGGFFFGDQAGRNGGANGKEHAMSQAGQNTGHDQGFITWCLPGHQVADGEQGHQAQHQGFAGDLAGQGGQDGGTYGNAQGVQADQQPGGGQAHGQVCRDGGEKANDHELCRSDGKGTDGQRQ